MYAEVVEKTNQEGINGDQAPSSSKAGDPSIPIVTEPSPHWSKSKKSRQGTRSPSQNKSRNMPMHDPNSNRKVQYEDTTTSTHNGTPRAFQAKGNPRPNRGRGKVMVRNRHAFPKHQANAMPVGGSQGSRGPMPMGRMSPGRHTGRRARGRGRRRGA